MTEMNAYLFHRKASIQPLTSPAAAELLPLKAAQAKKEGPTDHADFVMRCHRILLNAVATLALKG